MGADMTVCREREREREYATH
uniref:Uncharacterized protein n=1 Tax=Anguilla anguilla TaxID=7936 RepID=A0A0E9RJC1_ANGAN